MSAAKITVYYRRGTLQTPTAFTVGEAAFRERWTDDEWHRLVQGEELVHGSGSYQLHERHRASYSQPRLI